MGCEGQSTRSVIKYVINLKTPIKYPHLRTTAPADGLPDKSGRHLVVQLSSCSLDGGGVWFQNLKLSGSGNIHLFYLHISNYQHFMLFLEAEAFRYSIGHKICKLYFWSVWIGKLFANFEIKYKYSLIYNGWMINSGERILYHDRQGRPGDSVFATSPSFVVNV